MEIRSLNKNKLPVSKIGLGLAALGRPGYINVGHDDDLGSDKSVRALEARAHDVLDAAWEAGVRYFDAARSYGRAEEFLANWLKAHGISSDEISVSSKWGYRYMANWQRQAEAHEVKEHSLENLQRQIKKSREFLGDFLGLYQIHSATEESGVLESEAVLNELADLKAGGMLIGLTLSGAEQARTLERAVEIKRDGALLFDAVQATWNLLEPSVGASLQAAHEAGMGVIVKEALANGRLTDRNAFLEFDPQKALLKRIAQEQGSTIDALALAAVLAQPWADVVLSGATTLEHLQSNLRALDVDLADSDLDALAGVAEGPDEYWESRSNLEWN
jgi:aryl-alcohol dehydrogenase-like predicted oxidoreductase